MQNFDIFRTEIIQYIINKKWEEIIIYVYAYTFILWSNIIVIYLILATNLEIFIYLAFFFNSILIVWEAVQFDSEGKMYFKSLMNILDIFRFFITTIYLLLHCLNINSLWLSWTMITLNPV